MPISAEAGAPVSVVSSASSAVLRVLRADRRRGLVILDRPRGRARCDVILALTLAQADDDGFIRITSRWPSRRLAGYVVHLYLAIIVR